jgi:hypothetical protein
VAFRAQHEQPTELAHLFGGDGALLLRKRQRRRGAHLASATEGNLLVFHRVGVLGVRFAFGLRLLLDHRAAQQDVHAAPCHVGRDGHRAFAPRFGDNRGFLFVVLRVQHIVRDAMLHRLDEILGVRFGQLPVFENHFTCAGRSG